MKHDQVAKGGPKIVEFQMTVHEKEIVIDDEGTSFQALTFEGSMPGPTFVVHEASLAGRPPESHVETAWTFLKHGIPMGFVEEVAMAVMLSDGLRPKRSLNMQSEQSWSI